MSSFTLKDSLLPQWKQGNVDQRLSVTSSWWPFLEVIHHLHFHLELPHFLHWMLISLIAVSICSCSCNTIPRHSTILYIEWRLLTSDFSDLVPLEVETDNKLLSLLLLVPLPLLPSLFSPCKVNSSLLLLSPTISSNSSETHMAQLILYWHSRIELHWQNSMMVLMVFNKKNVSNGNVSFLCILLCVRKNC